MPFFTDLQNLIVPLDKKYYMMHNKSVKWSVNKTLNQNKKQEKEKLVKENENQFNK